MSLSKIQVFDTFCHNFLLFEISDTSVHGVSLSISVSLSLPLSLSFRVLVQREAIDEKACVARIFCLRSTVSEDLKHDDMYVLELRRGSPVVRN